MNAKTILISGASSGLGAAMAREFAARGYHLALCARRTDRLASLCEALSKAHGIRAEALSLDVNEYDQVFTVFREFHRRFGQLDRIVVNAGIGVGRRIGAGRFAENRAAAETNFVAALAQCEAAVEIFRQQNASHLVLISSMSAMRGLPRRLTTYAATKAGLAHLDEGIRAELLATPIKVSILYPGYIRTEINAKAGKLPFEVDVETGGRALAKTIGRSPAHACVPGWPWSVMGFLMRHLPLKWVLELTT